MGKIFDKVKSILYALPFGLKAANEEILGGGDPTQEGHEISQHMQNKSVYQDLINGEVTQEVEELRYGMYKVGREADNYEYIGSGVAIKKEKNKNKDGKIRFSQENKLVCAGVNEELKRVGKDYGFESYTMNISYDNLVKFKLEKYATQVDVLIDGEKIKTVIHFNEFPNVYEGTSMPFINELKKLYDLSHTENNEYGISRNEIASSMLTLHFTTFKATNDEPDLMSYLFVSPTFKGIEKDNGEYLLSYEWATYNREDLTDKFFSKEMQDKYDRKEKRKNATSVENFPRK
jgi:hypothetical protein